MNKRLFLHIINNGEEVAIKELLSYTYGAKRMGGAPTLTSTLQDFNILDINNKCWAMFADEDGVESGEVYYVKQVPHSTKSNTDARYKYDIEFIHERFVLDNIYLFDVDATLGSGSAEEKVSNKTEFIWSGNLYNYLIKLDAALEYSFKNAPSGYERYRVDFSGANRNDKKEVVISFKDVTFTAALQEIYNKFEVPYYFEGKTIYIGDQISSVVTTPLEYGANDALLSISKQNANHKTVNRCTGVGSSDNLPYYYPNDSATGEHEVTTTNGIVVDSINYDILGLYADLAQETYLKLSSRYDKDYSTDTTYKPVLNIDLPNRKPYVEGSLKTFDGSEGFKSQSATYAKSRSIEHFSLNRPSDVAFGNSFNEDGYVVHDYNDNSSSGGGSSSSTPTIPLGYLHKSVYSTALVTKSVYLAAESKADGLLHVEDITTVFNAYAKESTTISYQCNLKGYDLDPAGESFNVSKITSIDVKIYDGDELVKTYTPTNLTGTFDVSFTPTIDGHYKAVISITCSIDGNANEGNIYPISSELTIKRVVPSGAREYLLQLGKKSEDGEIVYDEKNYDLTTLGIYLGDSEATEGEIIISEGRNRMPNQKNLMPSIYRDTYGAERFYEATNGDYKVQYTDEWRDDNPQEYVYTFERSDDWDGFANPFEGEVHLRREHVISVEDIKPTIKEARYKGTRIDTLVDVAFDRDDNNDFDENEELKHGYFFVKLPPLGFNLFSMASEQGEMTISMTSGDCNSCSFVIGVGEKTKRNIVEVDSDGNLLRDENGNVKIGEDLEVQNDTTNNSVWLALKKDKSTFGVWMPDSKNHAMPKAGDTYVLLNIRLPKVYIMEAEKRLENEIVKFLKDNNDEKFNFSVKLSRIFFAKEENREVLESLNENSIVSLNYFGKNYSGLYVSSYQVRKNETDVLPEISISLTDSLAPNSAPLQNVVNQVKAEVMSSVNSIDFVTQAARTFIRKDKDDVTPHKISAQNVEVSDNITSSGPIKTYSNLDVTGYAKLLKGVHTDGDVTIGNYREILGNISGAKISKEGNASFNAIKANVLEIGSLTYNQARAAAAYTMFDDTATIVGIEYVQGGYILTLEGESKSDSGEFIQPFAEYDIVFGKVNKINNMSNARSGECWMRIDAILGNNKVRATRYSDEETPDGINLEPTIDMLIVHRGNCGRGQYERIDRQSTFYISSKDGNIVQLLGVTSPKLYNIDEVAPDGNHYSNYGVVMGKPTNDLHNYISKKYPYVRKDDPLLFAKHGIFENFLQLDHRGVPIKTANFRGEWSLDTATNDPYRVTFTTYDTVTHNGSLWECRLDGTVTEPSSNTTDWLLVISKGYDGAPTYSFRLSHTSITVDSDGGLSTTRLSFTIGETTARGYNILNNELQLRERKLKVQYSINGRIDNIADAGIALEDNSGFVLTEDGLKFMIDSISGRRNVKLSESGYLMFEACDGYISTEDGFKFVLEGNGGGIIPVDASCDLITLYLVDVENNIDLVVQDIPVIRDGKYGKNGENGKDGITVHGEPSTINIQISADDNKLINNKTHTFSVYARTATSLLQTEEYSVSIPNVSNYTFSTPYVANNKYNFTAIIADNAKKEDISSFSVKFTSKDGTNIGELVIAVSFAERGITGPAGKAGPMLYPAGTWNSDTEYRKENDSVPFVYYDHDTNDANEGLYYILQVDSVKSATNPAEDNTSWRAMTEYEAIYTKFIMANQARFGSENGGVFYDNWLFSAKKSDGSPWGGEKINSNGFFENTEDTVSPKLALDFKEGKLIAEEAKIKGHIEATSGKFTGELNANSGKIDSITATNLTVNSGSFSGKITANSGDIGGFTIGSNKLSATSAQLNFGKRIGDGIYCSMTATQDKEVTIESTKWILNIFRKLYNDTGDNGAWTTKSADIADNILMAYNGVIYGAYGPKYGYQYAMNGRGHLFLDGMVDGMCYQEIVVPNPTIEYPTRYDGVIYTTLDLARYGNRIFLKTSENNRHTIVFPTKAQFKEALGYGINSLDFRGATLKIQITNASVYRFDLIGKCDITLPSYDNPKRQPYNNDNYPNLYLKSGGSAALGKGESWIGARISKEFLLSLSEDESEYSLYELA